MHKKNILLKINTITLGSVFVLILVGGIVRSMGAGMGCPDWPKCFGEYVPPTSTEGLPDDYKEIYRNERIKKNARLANTMISLGYTDLADRITNDPFVLEGHDFDATKAWIEYINRLIGVLIGLFVFANMIFSFSYRKKSIWVPIVGVSIFILTGFQGWVGSLVVSTNLLHGFITFHMLLALLIVALLIWMNVKIREQISTVVDKQLFWISMVLLVLFIPQILLGTEVRGIIDDLLVSTISRANWIDSLSVNTFYIHRSYSWLFIIGTFGIVYLVKKKKIEELATTSQQLLMMVTLAISIGVGMVTGSFAFWLQPLHLIVATGIFSLLFYLTLRLSFSK